MNKQTHCAKGHVLEGSNIYTSPKSGARCCLQCKREHNRAYSASHQLSDAVKRHRKDWYARTGYDRKRLYGLSKEAFDAKMKEQDNRCASCGEAFTEENKPHVDHNHACTHVTTKGGRSCIECVRGLLCGGCNIAIGYLAESAVRAEQAASYLRKWTQHANRRTGG